MFHPQSSSIVSAILAASAVVLLPGLTPDSAGLRANGGSFAVGLDSDGDGLHDALEARIGTNYSVADTDSDVLDDYERLNELLRKRYPSAEAYEKNWSNDLFTAKPGEWARAVRIGHLEFDWQHEASGLLITHNLRGSRREISHVLEYEASSDNSIGDALEQL